MKCDAPFLCEKWGRFGAKEQARGEKGGRYGCCLFCPRHTRSAAVRTIEEYLTRQPRYFVEAGPRAWVVGCGLRPREDGARRRPSTAHTLAEALGDVHVPRQPGRGIARRRAAVPPALSA